MTYEESLKAYPKFYANPGIWIDAIEVKVIEDIHSTYRKIEKNERFMLTALTLHTFESNKALKNIMPCFETQDGEVFKKDLLECVNLSVQEKGKYINVRENKYRFIAEDLKATWAKYTISFEKGALWDFNVQNDFDADMQDEFNCFTFLDEMRKRGYYL